ncbi:hypothetical protein KRR40_27340 [Niabella defluvii]|nr:hypothetical protein KRR40_27340 [Niabella sp. I65]
MGKKKGNYEAGFDLAKTGYSVLIDASVTFLKQKWKSKCRNCQPMPKPMFLTSMGAKNQRSSKITDNTGVVTYEAEVKART